MLSPLSKIVIKLLSSGSDSMKFIRQIDASASYALTTILLSLSRESYTFVLKADGSTDLIV